MDTIKRLLNNELVYSKELEEATGLTFSELMHCKRLELCRTAKWNKAPLNGQFIETFFRIK